MRDPSVQALLEKYEIQTNNLHDYYAKSEGVEMQNASAPLVQYKAFVRFANQTKLVPTMISGGELNRLYKSLASDKAETGLGLGVEGFLEALVRLCVLTRKRLSGDSAEAQSEGPGSKDEVAKGPSKPAAFRMEGMSADSLERFFVYLRLDPADKKATLVQKLNGLPVDPSKAASTKLKKPAADVEGMAPKT
jgi:hypothetical protein